MKDNSIVNWHRSRKKHIHFFKKITDTNGSQDLETQTDVILQDIREKKEEKNLRVAYSLL